MSHYFNNQLAILKRTKDFKTVIRTVAGRYIGQNPPIGASYYAYQKSGIRQNNQYKFVFNFDQLFPLSTLESNIYAWSKLWSDQDANMPFEMNCFGPVIIYCNGERVYKPNVYQERTSSVSAGFTLKLMKGWNNIVLRFIYTNTGCGGLLGAVSSRHRPLSFIIPSRDREGQKGWLYTLPLAKPLEHLPEAGMTEEETGQKWYPVREWLPEEQACGQMKRMYSLRKGYYAVGWSRLFVGKSGEYAFKGAHDGAIALYLDDQCIYHQEQSGVIHFKTEISYGEHDILVKSTCGEREWGFTLACLDGDDEVALSAPETVSGSSEAWFYAGPFAEDKDFTSETYCSMDKPLALETLHCKDKPLARETLHCKDKPFTPETFLCMDKPFEGADGKVYWRLDKPGTVIRPYNNNKLFGQWNYPLGVTLYGMLEAGRLLEDTGLINYAAAHVEESIRYFDYAMWDGKQYGAASMHNLLTTITTLDDCGSFGSFMLEASTELKEDTYVRIADYVANFIENELERLPDGAFYRGKPDYQIMYGTLWADDLYMSIPFLCRYYKMTGQPQYIDDAANQLILYHKYLYRPELKIMSHVYDANHKKSTEVSWGRGNGWVAFSYSELLAVLPTEHPLKEELLEKFNTLCQGYLALQDEEGMWHQVLTDHSSYAEASCTSMFICAFARGVCNGWLSEPERYIRSVKKAWDGLCRNVIDQDGNVYGICQGSGFSFSADYYKNDLSWNLNDTHGTGIILLAGVEYGKLLNWLTSEGKV